MTQATQTTQTTNLHMNTATPDPTQAPAPGQAPAAAPLARRLDPGLKRNLLIIGGVLMISVIGVMVMLVSRMGAAPAQGPAGVALPAASPTGTPTAEPMSPVMQQLVREQQIAEADAARRAGRPYIPPDSGAPEPLPDNQGPKADSRLGAIPGAVPGTTPVLINSGMTTPEEQMARERTRRGLEVQLRDMLSTNAPPREIARVQVAAQPVAGGAAGTAGATSAVAPAAAPTAPTAQTALAGPALADALEIFPATTLTPVDTYQTGYISARIVGGKLAGAFLVGRTQMVNEGLQPRFTQMRLNNKTYAIDAIALDEASGADSVRANLDRRYLQRYVMPIVVAMVGGYTAARAQTGSQVVGIGTDGTGGSGITLPAPTEKQAVYAGVSQAMSMTQRAVDQEAALPIRASLPAGTAIGVMFNAPVADVDASREAAQEAARNANSARRDTMPATAAPLQARPVGQMGTQGQGAQVGFGGTGALMPGMPGGVGTSPGTRVPGLPGAPLQ
jgi:hypothetical protein